MKKQAIIIIIIILIGSVLTLSLFYGIKVFAGTLSCSITTDTACTGTVILRMSGAMNAHAELPSQSNAAYASNVVCCTGVTGLGNSCSGVYAKVLNLSNVTNAHVEESNLSNYATSACISVPTGGSVSIGYDSTNNCAAFDTTLASIVTTTNSHIGSGSVYPLKVCATAAAAAGTVSCDVSATSTSFGSIDANSIYTASPNITVSSTCSYSLGCTIQINDAGNGSSAGLYKSTTPTYLISSTSTTLSAGTEGYGIQATTTTAGSGATFSLNPIYNVSGNSVGGLSLTTITLASTTASYTGRQVVVTHKVSLKNTSYAGNYADTITYSCLGN